MIELSEKSVMILDPEGTTAPLNSDLLRTRLADALETSGSPDPDLAADIALAVEYALRERLRISPTLIRSADVELLADKILTDLGMTSAVLAFRRTAPAGTVAFVVEIQRIRALLEGEFADTGADLDRTAKKVFHTLQSIGAESAQPALITELARHFLLSGAGEDRNPVPLFTPDHAPCTISPEVILKHLTHEEAKELIRKRIISLRSLDLRVFPVLHFDLRLSGLAGELPEGTLTELTLAPVLYQTADAMDAVSLAADAACRESGHETETPLKTALHFSDSSVFTHDFMGCSDEKSQKACTVSLSGILCSALSRQPIRVTCR